MKCYYASLLRVFGGHKRSAEFMVYMYTRNNFAVGRICPEFFLVKHHVTVLVNEACKMQRT